MKTKTVITAGALSLAAFAFPSAPAVAQTALPSYEVMTMIRSMGLDPVDRPVRRGPNYVLRAIDGYGEEVTVTVDALRGRVVSVRPAVPEAAPYATAPVYAPPRYAAPPSYYGPPPPYYPEAEFESGATYEPMPPSGAGPRVIYAPRASNAPPAPARAAVKPPVTKSTPANPAPAAAEAAPAPEQPTGSISGATPPAENSPALAIPPVQTLE